MKLNLLSVVIVLAFLSHTSLTSAQFQCPPAPDQVGDHSITSQAKGDITASVAKVLNAPVGSVDVKGELRTLSKKIVKDYPGVNEGTALLAIGSFCCQAAAQATDPGEKIRLYKDCMSIRQEGEQKVKNQP